MAFGLKDSDQADNTRTSVVLLKCLESHDPMSSYVSLLNLFATALTEISQTECLTYFRPTWF